VSILSKYNAAVREKCCLIASATNLFYDMITLHPFSDGNGRLCRLLVSYALMRGGFPFYVTLSSYHRKSRNHYMMAILEGRRNPGNLSHLRTLVLKSALCTMYNYIENKRICEY
jgi:Fic family protein